MLETFTTQSQLLIQETILPKNDEVIIVLNCPLEKEKSKLALKIVPFDSSKKNLINKSNGQPRNKKKLMELIKNIIAVKSRLSLLRTVKKIKHKTQKNRDTVD